MSGEKVDALLLAGRRRGEDPLLSGPDAPESKALIEIGGLRMIDRVLAALRGAEAVGAVAATGLSAEHLPDDVKEAETGAGPASAIYANRGLGAPLFVTTCDHALLTTEIVEAFLAGAQATDADLVAAFATRDVIDAAWPGMKRTYLDLGGQGYSGCNLFLIHTEAGFEAIRQWVEIERHRKNPLAVAWKIGPGLILRYPFRRFISIDRLFAYISRRAGVRVRPVILPFANAAVDVDKPSDLAFVKSVLEGGA